MEELAQLKQYPSPLTTPSGLALMFIATYCHVSGVSTVLAARASFFSAIALAASKGSLRLRCMQERQSQLILY
jgi:hypothetical protein